MHWRKFQSRRRHAEAVEKAIVPNERLKTTCENKPDFVLARRRVWRD